MRSINGIVVLFVLSALPAHAATVSSAGGGSGSVTSVDAQGGVETSTNTPITGVGSVRGNLCVHTQTGTSYTVAATDRGCMVTFENAGAVDVTIPEAGTAGFDEGFYFIPVNLGVGTVTITPNVSLLQGQTELSLMTGQSTTIASSGTEYVHSPGISSATVSSGWPLNLGSAASTSESAGQFLSIRGQGAQVNNGADLYQSSLGRFELVCVVANVRKACDYTRDLGSGRKWELQNSASAPIFTVIESNGAIENAKLDSRGTGNVITVPFRWDFDLCSISPADSALAHIFNKDPLSTAPTLTAKSGTNRSTCVGTFPDSDGDFGIAITRRLPTGYVPGSLSGTYWWDTTGTGNVAFQVAVKCFADNEVDDVAYNTASVGVSTAGTAGRPNIGAFDITDTGCAGGELMRIRIFRNRTHASDTLNSSVNVEKVYLSGYTEE
ncbi:MAG: hypothetical protein ACRCZI_09490 [Cetobacterium sp.]